MGLGPISRSAIMSYAAESGFGVDASDQFFKIIRELDVEFLHSANATQSKGKLIEEVPITDVKAPSNSSHG